MSSNKKPRQSSTRQCRPTEKVALVAQSRMEKENLNREAAERAEYRKKKQLATEKKATDRERDLQGKNKQPTRPNIADTNTLTGRDPAFTTVSSATPHIDLRKRTSVVPAAPKKSNPTPSKDDATKTYKRVLTSAKAAELAKIKALMSTSENEESIVPRQATSSELYWPDSGNEEDDDMDGLADQGDHDDFDMDQQEGEDSARGNSDVDEDDPDRSPSPGIGDKRSHSPAGTESQWRKPVKIHATTGAKPKAGDYEPAVQNVLTSAIGIYRGYLSDEHPYPDSMTEIRWAKRAWKEGCEECDARIFSNSEIIKLITSRSSHFRGQVKTKVTHHFKGMYGFVSSANAGVIEQNVKLARELKKKYAFACAERSPDGNKGLYHHPIIQEVVNEQWFSNRKDDGLKYPDVYKPFPKVALALILTAIECCIDEWADGTRSSIQFTQDAYEDVFHDNLEELNRFHEHTKVLKLLPTILQELHDAGRLNAKADPLGQPKRAQSPSAYAAAMEEFKEAHRLRGGMVGVQE